MLQFGLTQSKMPNSYTAAKFDFLPDRIRKTYRSNGQGANLAQDYYRRELEALHWFTHNKVPFIPRLLSYDKKELWFEIETIESAATFAEWSCNASSNALEPVITQLIMIDKFLFDRRINYLSNNPANVLIDSNFRVYIVDFKHTRLDQPYKRTLFDFLFNFVSSRAQTNDTACIVQASLSARRNEFHRYIFRKLAHTLRGPLEVIRPHAR